jgi:arylsulfatase
MTNRLVSLVAVAIVFATAVRSDAQTRSGQSQSNKPNILVIWGDDIGTWNISHNNHGMMGYKTPNIDRIAREGVSFTDY